MHRRNILSISAIIVFSLALLLGGAVGQQKSVKEQIVGVWTLVSFDSFDGSGAKVPNMEGGNGSYTVSEADKTVSLSIERSSFPNQVASSVKRVATFTGDELKLDNPGRLAGGRTVTVWRRVK